MSLKTANERARARMEEAAPQGFVPFTAAAAGTNLAGRVLSQATIHATRSAVVDAGRVVTYAELCGRAGRVAAAIESHGIPRDVPVAIMLPHGSVVVEAILGCVLAGRPYVPLDPSFPERRNRFIWNNAGAGVLLTHSPLLAAARAAGIEDRAMVAVDRLPATTGVVPPAEAIEPLTPACILYTSGSTGEPKGVVQTHGNLLNDVAQYTNCLRIAPEDRMTLLYSCSVNGALRGLFGALLNGASVYPFDVKAGGFTGLERLIRQAGITFYHSVPSLYRQFLGERNASAPLESVRVARLGGERARVSDVALYKRHFTDRCVLYTGMGATETGHIRHLFIDRQTELGGSVVPTGYAVEDKTVLILDESGEPVPHGAVGSIAVKSAYLSPGYWKASGLTARAFTVSPTDGERIFHTGDRGRLTEDGCLELHGRADTQLKIRGFRIEAGEVESALLEHEALGEVVVANRDERLVAYYSVLSRKPPPSHSSLRDFARKRLPPHMVPSLFLAVDRFALTPNGKVDRRALPDTVPPERPQEEARTPLETEVAQICEHILGRRPIGAHQSFHELGGDSLMLIRVSARIAQGLGVELPLLEVFKNPTVAALTQLVADARERESS